MNEPCPICGYPRTWSDDHGRVWCAIYGAHTPPPRPIHERPTLVVLPDLEDMPKVDESITRHPAARGLRA